MKNTVFKGSGVAIVTPFKKDGSVNYDVLGELIEFQIENQTDSIVVCGTTGESPTLKHDEHMQIIEYTIRKVNGRIPVIAGTGSNDTEHSIDFSIRAQKLGADALLSVSPYYNKTSQAGLVAHYTKIADSVDIPIFLYNVPSRTGCNILPQTYKQLSKHKNICAIKEANGDISSVVKTMSLCGKDVDVYSGNDDQIVPIMALGGIGVISVFANVCPKECHNLTMAMLNGDIKKARKIQIDYAELIDALFMDVNPMPVKEALNMMGFECGECRLPLVSISDNQREKLRKTLEKYGIIK